MMSCNIVLCLMLCAHKGFDIVQGHTTSFLGGELHLSGNHSVTEYEMSREPYSQKSGWIKHSNERIFQLMTFK